MNKRGIYSITNRINNKKYIGESLNIERRWEEHIESLNSNKHHSYKLQKDWNTYGQGNFEFEVIKELDSCIPKYLDQYILIVYEDKEITKYNSIEEGYNVENTIYEIFNNNRNITNNIEKDKGILKRVIKNIEKNNGEYITKEMIDIKKNKKVYCIENKKLYNSARIATKECKPTSSCIITNICKKGGGKVKLKNGEYLTFIYYEDYLITL